MKNSTLHIDDTTLNKICHRYHISRLALFGSVLRGEQQPDSDIDLLVEFAEGKIPGLAFFTLQDELSALFRRKVDLNTPNFLSRYFRQQVIAEAEELYVS
ncbi:MAG: nucleotidyltransferase family protein [Pseudomonadota bacterium]